MALGRALFLASLAVHIVLGVILGVLAQRWIRDRGTIFTVLSEALGREHRLPQTH